MEGVVVAGWICGIGEIIWVIDCLCYFDFGQRLLALLWSL